MLRPYSLLSLFQPLARFRPSYQTMSKFSPAMTALAAGVAVAAVATSSLPSNAADVSYKFDISIDSGPLNGNSYMGVFSYDDQTFALTDLSFSFEGVDYNEGDDPTAIVFFSGPNLLGLGYSIDGTPSFSFVPGDEDISGAFFAYDLQPSEVGQGGAGNIVYTQVATPKPSSVPAPFPLAGAAAFYGFSRKLRYRIQQVDRENHSSFKL